MHFVRLVKHTSYYVFGLAGLGGLALSLSDCNPTGPSQEDCQQAGDEDGNGSADCDDRACDSYPECSDDGATETNCRDGRDDDRDGARDCEDVDCEDDDACIPPPDCGDGTVDNDEECDDGNNTSGDGCSAACTNEGTPAAECGDGTVDEGEECDDGNNMNGDGCSTTCIIDDAPTEECGDETVDTGEECDDGNNMSGDGCSATCSNETVENAEICDDEEDNDGDDDIDCDDADCEADSACEVTDPCENVTCDMAPLAACDGDTLTSYASSGTCTDGTCNYDATTTDCADTGMTCSTVDEVDQCVGKMIFLTASPTNANLSGVAGADALCSAEAPNDSAYKALIVDGVARVACTSADCGDSGSDEQVDWVLAPSTLYQRLDGTVIGTTNDVGIFPHESMLQASIAGGNVYYTGLSEDWTTSPDTCDGWTVTDASTYAMMGAGDLSEVKWAIAGSSQSCANPAGAFLACVEQ